MFRFSLVVLGFGDKSNLPNLYELKLDIINVISIFIYKHFFFTFISYSHISNLLKTIIKQLIDFSSLSMIHYVY